MSENITIQHDESGRVYVVSQKSWELQDKRGYTVLPNTDTTQPPAFVQETIKAKAETVNQPEPKQRGRKSKKNAV